MTSTGKKNIIITVKYKQLPAENIMFHNNTNCERDSEDNKCFDLILNIKYNIYFISVKNKIITLFNSILFIQLVNYDNIYTF